MSSQNGDLMQYPFSAQAPTSETIPMRPGLDEAVRTLRVTRSAQITKPQVNVDLILPENVMAPEVVPTKSMSSTLDLFFTAPLVDADVAPRNGRTYYTPLEAAQVLGMSSDEVVWWAEISLIPARRVRGQWRISAKWLDRYRPTAQAVKGMDTRLTDDDLVRLIRLGRRPWAWPAVQDAR